MSLVPAFVEIQTQSAASHRLLPGSAATLEPDAAALLPDRKKNTHCVCYLADEAYLFPTALSAIQVRRYLPASRADVVVIASDVPEQLLKAFARLFVEHDIRLLSVPENIARLLEQLQREQKQFHGRISASALGRLALAEILPSQYTDFIYLDGDTQVSSSLEPLLFCEVPRGRFMAARDYATIMRPFNMPWAAQVEAHHRRLGLSVEQGANYCNSGVIRAERDLMSALSTSRRTSSIRLRGTVVDRCPRQATGRMDDG